MTDRDIERSLRQAIDRTAPDQLQAVLSRCGSGKGTVIEMKKHTVGKTRRLTGLIAACLALVLLAGSGGGFAWYRANNAVASVVSLDVNPSIELRVNRSEKVLSCAGMNDDGRQVLADMNGGLDLEGAKLVVAVNAVVGALVRSGYLDSLGSALLISVEDSDTDRGARLQQELVASVDGVLQNAANQASVLSQNVTADAALTSRAQENSISTGKAHLVDQVLALNGELRFDELAALSVEELRDLIKTGVPGMPIGRDGALEAVLAFAGLTKDDYTFADVDPELDEATPYYEVELLIDGREQDYGVHAYTGEVIRGVKTPSVFNPGPALPPTDDTAGQSQTQAQTQTARSGYISREDALTAVLDRAGLTRDSVGQDGFTGYEVDGELDELQPYYQVELKIGGREYEYRVDAATGQVISEPEMPLTDPTITAADAARIALDHAGVKSDETEGSCYTKADLDDDHPNYDVEFTAGGYEYDYEIDAYTGEVSSFKKEALPPTPSGAGAIDGEAAKAIALDHAGLTEDEVSRLKCKLDRGDGRQEYEVEFRAGGYEYEYTIDAATGAVLDHERDRDD